DEGDIWISPATLKRASERHEYPKRDFAYLDTADHTPRIAFDFLIGLIHPVSVRRAADRFEAKIVEYAERYLRCREVLDRIEKSVVEHDVAELRNALKTAERDAVIWKNLQQNVKPVRPFSPVLSMDPAAFSLNSSEPEDGSNDDMDNVMKILRNMEEATSRIDEAVESQTMLSDCLSILGSFAANPCYLEFPPADDYPESLSEILEPLRGFSVGNPFETCFAYLYLLDSGAPSAWVEPAVYAILYTAATLLPWYCDPRLDEVSDPFGTMIRKALFEGGEEKRDWDSGNGSDAESSEETDELSYEETDEPEDEEPPDWNDHFIEFFRKSIFFDGPESGENDDGESESAEDRQTGGNGGVRSLSEYPTDEVFVNFSQYLYRMTGLLYPRDNEIEKDLALLHEHCGFSEEAALLMERLCHLSDTIRSAQTKNMSVTDVDRLVLEHFGREEEKEEPEPDGQSAEEKLARLSEQLSKRKEELKAEHEEHALTRKRAEKLEQENAELKAELNELRTMIRQDSGNEEQSGPDSAPSSPPVPLPYAASGRYVVFGGHDSWLKAIRPLLPNVRFINKKMRPDPNLIRNADVVWLQSNAIGHPDYYFITDLVRTAGIPIRYFSFASAEKCAEQLARFDMERGEASENRTEE
ncbi:MAG: hypothetical protein ILO68_05390, partial [Clostridia bacterium]|nr:hypothetical protein [Clostridia bacterium]